jgi:hypothetical protein
MEQSSILGGKSYSGSQEFISLFETGNMVTITNSFHSQIHAEYIYDYDLY